VLKVKMFIIVETIEDGKKNLCVEPESWEKNEILYWPSGRKGLNLKKEMIAFYLILIILRNKNAL